MLGEPSMKAAKTDGRRASEPMPGSAKFGCRLQYEVRKKKHASELTVPNVAGAYDWKHSKGARTVKKPSFAGQIS